MIKEQNKHSKTFDDVNVINEKVYDISEEKEEKEDYEEEEEKEKEKEKEKEPNIDCVKSEKLITGNWYKIFPKQAKEISYNELPQCTFEILIHILKEFDSLTYRDVNIQKIKELLVESYQKYNEIINKILKLLIHEGKPRAIINTIIKKKYNYAKLYIQ